jgi:hypothetical protein
MGISSLAVMLNSLTLQFEGGAPPAGALPAGTAAPAKGKRPPPPPEKAAAAASASAA